MRSETSIKTTINLKPLKLVRYIVALCFTIFLSLQAEAQFKFVVSGVISVDDKKLDGAVVTLYKGGTVAQQFSTSSNGKYSFSLDPNQDYIIQVTKPGHITKKISCSTKGLSDEQIKNYSGSAGAKADVGIFETPKDPALASQINSILSKPVAKLYFDPVKENIDYDQAYTNSMLSALDNLQKLEQEANKKAAEEKAKYDAAIAKADAAFAKKDYDNAKASYTEASNIKPFEQKPKDKLAEIEKLLAANANAAAIEEKYKAAVAKGDAAMGTKSYENAKAAFNEAAGLKPAEKYPKDKLAEIDKLIAALANAAASEEKYKAAIAKGDAALGQKDYNNAKTAYTEATGLKPSEKYPKDKLAEIDKILADLAAKDKADKALKEKYDAAIAKGDKALAAKTYPEAKAAYTEALGLKPNEQYPKDKIAEIDAAIAKELGEKKLEENYKAAVAKGDKALIAKTYPEAKAAYNEALGFKPNEKYPKDKIAEIDKLLADANAEKERLAKEKELNEKYAAAIAKGDAAMVTKSYEAAKPAYTEALGLKPTEKYPKDKLAEIEKLLASSAAEKELNAKYTALIDKADASFGTKEYEKAKGIYNEALGLKPAEKYPKDKIAAIDKLMADLAAKEKADKELNEKYAALIAKADKALGDKKYADAKGIYSEALGLKKDEQYPKDKIAEIDAAIAKELGDKKLEESYKAAIAKGDKALGSKDYDNAKAGYNEALGFKTNEQYPKDKLAEIEKALAALASEKDRLAKEKELEEKYKAVITKGDADFGTKSYATAKTAYTDALGLKPNEKYPKERIAEIDKLIAKELGEKEIADKYNDAIAKADAALATKDYNNAKTGYNEALGIKSSEKYPKDKIAEIDKILSDLAAKEKSDKELNEKYAALIAKADKALGDKKYTDAKGKYTEALGLKKDEQYPKDKLVEIDAALAKELGDKKLEESYKAAIAKADKALGSKDYDNAKAAYNEALGFKPNEQYPKDKLAEIEKALAALASEKDRLAQERELEEKYKAAIAKGDADFGTKSYATAKTAYTDALGLKPNEKYPKERIAEIDKLIAKELGEKELADKYNAAIAKADAALATKDYNNAKAGYNEALGFKPAEKYPKDKLAEIDKILADLAAKEKFDKELNEKYAALIAKADKALGDKKYTDAKGNYTEASNLKKDEQYPKDKIAEIDAILAKELGAKQLEENYKAAIAKGDKALGSKDYENAKAGYNEALGLKPNEQYPKDKLAEIEKALAALASEKDRLAKEKELEDNYKAAIAKGDADFGTKSYATAKTAYTDALGLKPNEKYPKERISEIDKLMAKELGEKELADKYNAAIAKADAALATKDYNNAKAGYNEALGFKPAEKYPKDKLAEIDKILADLAAREKSDKELNEKYAALIAKADKALGDKKYTDAKGNYNEALNLKKDEQYPKDKIAEIDAILAKELGAKQLEENYKAAIAKGDKALGSKDYDNAKAGYNEALGLKPNEQYPKDKLAEIEKLIAKDLSEKELNDRYNAAISKADGSFAAKDYSNAKAGYNEALGIKSNEKYPKDKLAEIEKLLAELLAKDKADKELTDRFNAIIAKADKFLADKKYTEARAAYNEALGLKSNEQYPKDKIAEIDGIIAKELGEKQLEENYKAAIAKGDRTLAVKDYENSKAGYTAALGLKPNEQYPKDKLAEVTKILDDMAKADELEAKYKAAITKGDGSFNIKDYDNAKAAYTEALSLKSNQQYPKDQLLAIDKAVAEQNKYKSIKEKYDAAISKADAAFASKDYASAITSYKEAQAVKPNEVYPVTQISECTKQMDDEARAKRNEQRYADAIAKGDKLFDTKDYVKSKAAYNEALMVKSSEKYPKDRILEIDAILKKKNDAIIIPNPTKKDKGPDELALKYGEGIFEEYAKEGKNNLVIRVVVKGNEGHKFIQKTTNFGTTYWYKDGVLITEQEFIKNTEQ